MKKISLVLLGLSVLLVVGCHFVGIRGNGQIKTDERTVSAFANVDIKGGFEIEWQDGAPSLRITTDENLLSYIENYVAGDTLYLRTHEQLRPTHGIRLTISSPTRLGARISGAVRFTAKQLSAPRFALESRGASQVSLDGSVNELFADMTGASELKASALQTKTAEISTTGAGSADIAVADTLKVVITGAGEVKYSGNPATIQKHITGAGSIKRKN